MSMVSLDKLLRFPVDETANRNFACGVQCVLDYASRIAENENASVDIYKDAAKYTDEEIEKYCSDVFFECFDTDCSKCPLSTEVGGKICKTDLIIQLYGLWKKSKNQHVEFVGF